jgi:hypothetical protein
MNLLKRPVSQSVIRRRFVAAAQSRIPVATPVTTHVAQRSSSTSVDAEALDSSTAATSTLSNRLKVTAEVMVSKIFPAGFGWQYSSCIAADMGLEATDLGFFLTTGFGDFCGVLAGHSLYMLGKSLVTDGIDRSQEVKTGFWLASAAFCSGAAWQPIVNALQMAQLPWAGVALGTWATCGAAFYGGLRLGRMAYSPLNIVPAASTENNVADAALSMSIGGATGAFVGTDVAYLPAENPLGGLVGISEADSMATGCVKAGSSTFLGFFVAQMPQNILWKKGKNWTD